ncbi:hypothetical protein LV779_03000 [Streptomyces thinghirensis]|nr:hypothetical protein [Streptomyces thinghirensis]
MTHLDAAFYDDEWNALPMDSSPTSSASWWPANSAVGDRRQLQLDAAGAARSLRHGGPDGRVDHGGRM